MKICLILSIWFFVLGFIGIFLIRKHIISVLINFEFLLLASNLNFVFFSLLLDDILGQIYTLYILAIAASESALGLAFILVYYKLRGGIAIDIISLLKT